MTVIIETKDLSCRAGKYYLLDHIDWQIEKGEHWLVFGLNGSGKTTLLSLLAGFKMPSSGTLKVFGQSYNKENVLTLRKRFGWVSSSFFDKFYTKEAALTIVLSGLFGTLGVAGYVADKDIVRAKELLARLRVGDKVYTPFSMLSKGERQNVLIARALISKPEVLLLDEPGTGLDVCARVQMMAMVENMASKTQTTIVYVTHYLEEIQPIFSKCLLLKNGRTFAKGDTADLEIRKNFKELLEREKNI